MIAHGCGRVERTNGGFLFARLPAARVGDGVRIFPSKQGAISGVVAGVANGNVSISPFASLDGVAAGDRVQQDDSVLGCVLGFAALGRGIDAAGAPLDGGCILRGHPQRVRRDAPPPFARTPVSNALWTGVRAIDALLTVGRGARLGIFGAPGTGKTTLLENITEWSSSDAVVVALIGERGREAATWLSKRNRRMTVVCATGDRPAAEQLRAAETAMAQAAILRDRGLHVLLIFDSLARYASALRETRMGLGEPVGRGGFPASVFAELARLLERAGAARGGSVTMLASVLSDGSDERDPVSEAARSLLDGHIALSLTAAHAGRFPAIDVLASTSRTMQAAVDAQALEVARTIRAAIARLHETSESRELGLLANPDPLLRRVLAAQPALDAFLTQRERSAPADTARAARALAALLQVEA